MQIECGCYIHRRRGEAVYATSKTVAKRHGWRRDKHNQAWVCRDCNERVRNDLDFVRQVFGGGEGVT
jgi:hypothetical protein